MTPSTTHGAGAYPGDHPRWTQITVAGASVGANATTNDSQSLHLACHSRAIQVRHAGRISTPLRS
jgi:hypothetical protein